MKEGAKFVSKTCNFIILLVSVHRRNFRTITNPETSGKSTKDPFPRKTRESARRETRGLVTVNQHLHTPRKLDHELTRINFIYRRK